MKQMLSIKLISFLFLIGCASTPSSQTTPTSLDNSWSGLFLEQSLDAFIYETVTPTSEETGVGISTIFSLSQSDLLVGYAYQATVDGNGGRDSVTFRLTIYGNKYQGFDVVDHREHNAFGVKQFNALTNALPGTEVDFDLVKTILIEANAGRSGISETYDGIMPAIERMTEKYLSL